MENKRQQWSNNLLFLLAAIGSAVGLGNLWGFPYKMGANGGMYFLIIYLAMAVLCGVVVTVVEMAIGRHTGKSPIEALGQLNKKWKIVGAFGSFSATLITGFYSVLIGYSLRYFVGFFIQIFGADGFYGLNGTGFFTQFTLDVGSVVLYTVLALVISGAFVVFGTKGLERFNKYGIPGLFLILVGLSIYNLTLPGATDGYIFMFTTKGLEIAGQEFDFLRTVRTAGGQVLFSMSLGMGIMITYGSYLSKEENIAKNSLIIPIFDTLAAVLAGMVIFPAVFATGQQVNAGPGLLYITMHDVFTTMGAVGNVVGALFYLLVIFAGVSSAISLLEGTTSSVIDGIEAKGKKPDRKKVTLLALLVVFVLSIPICLDSLGLNGENGIFYPLYFFLGEDSRDLLDLYDLITEGILMPLAAVLMCLIVGWKLGPKWLDNELEQNGQKFHGKKFFHFCIKFVTPLLMTFVLVSLALSYFGL